MITEVTASEIQKELDELSDEEQAKNSRRFFKTGPGEYGEGDRFRGIRVPVLRRLARRYHDKSTLSEIERLLQSPFHEDRFVALVILIERFKRGDEDQQTSIYRLYLRNARHINSWDLVDASAEHIIGAYLWDRDRTPLHELVESENLWERRMAIMSTFHFIKRNAFGETLNIADVMLGDGEDLIHKAAGWMLREIGERNRAVEEAFLQEHYRQMPRTMLRYAIEKFPEERRQRYLKGAL